MLQNCSLWFDIASLRLLCVHIHLGTSRGSLCVKPVCPELACAPNPPPVAHETPVAEEAAHYGHAVEPVSVGVRLYSKQMHLSDPPPTPGGDVVLFLAHRSGMTCDCVDLSTPDAPSGAEHIRNRQAHYPSATNVLARKHQKTSSGKSNSSTVEIIARIPTGSKAR